MPPMSEKRRAVVRTMQDMAIRSAGSWNLPFDIPTDMRNEDATGPRPDVPNEHLAAFLAEVVSEA